MKGLLVFLLLLISFIVNVELKCQPNEVLDEQTQTCQKFCEIGEVFNLETSTCESNTTNYNCPEGQIFNNQTSLCEDKPQPNNGGKPVNEGGDPVNEGGDPVNGGGDPVNGGGDPVNNPKPKQDKCIDGIIKDGKCTCPPN